MQPCDLGLLMLVEASYYSIRTLNQHYGEAQGRGTVASLLQLASHTS
jgi:hypothetical protein